MTTHDQHIDAELAEQADAGTRAGEVCGCEKPPTLPGAFRSDGISICINCGKRVEVSNG